MSLFKPRKETDKAGEQIKARLAELTAMERELQEMPERLKREEEERARMLPPSDLLTARHNEKLHEFRVSRGEFRNTRRELTRSLLLFALLICSVIALLWWAFTFLKGQQVF